LGHNTTLRAIDLSANTLQTAGVLVLLEALAAHPALEWLDLHANSIHDDAMPAIVEFVAGSKALRSLNIAANYLTDKSADVFAGGEHCSCMYQSYCVLSRIACCLWWRRRR
jgi:hypothetical protein